MKFWKFTLSAVLSALILAISVSAYGAYDEQFFRLCRNGSYQQILQALRRIPSVKDMKTSGGFTALMAASESNTNPEVISLLIQKGADVNAKMFAGMTALLWASWRNPNPEVVRVLLSHGADTNWESDNGKRAADYAYMNENLAGTEIVKILEQGGKLPGEAEPAKVEPEKPKPSIKPEEVKPSNKPKKADPPKHPDTKPVKPAVPSKPTRKQEPAKPASTAGFLELCASGSPSEILEALKNGGHDPNTKNFYGTTALMFAAEKNSDAESIRVLCGDGADVNAKDEGGQTPLMYAAASNINAEVINALLMAGADVKPVDSRGRTALMISAGKNAEAKVTALLSEADKGGIDRQDSRGWTALFWASYSSSSPEVITVLLNAGANPKIRGSAGELAVDYARRNKHLSGSEALGMLEKLSR